MNHPENRIIDHVQIRAGDIVPRELNPRTHTDAQRQALAGLLDEIGFARSLLAYRLPDGRLKLIDGHLRQSLTRLAENLFDAYWQAQIETGFHYHEAPQWETVSTSIKRLWRAMALRSAKFMAEHPSVN